MDTLQNSRSAFRELRLAAGYETQSALSEIVRAQSLVSRWDSGIKKPSWSYIPKLAEAFKVQPAELIRKLWNEEVGSLCSCGCRNTKVLPNYHGALHLSVERVCADCGNKQIYRYVPKHGHPRLCENCRSTPRSKFHELRLAAGVTQAQLAKDLKIWTNTVLQWDRGRRPKWQYVPLLSQILHIDLNEAVRLFWNETVGDLCHCCGGELVFPDYEQALHLTVKLQCKTCEMTVRTYRHRGKHSKECRICSFARRGKAPPLPSFTVKCVGYRPYGAKVALFANGCRRETRIRPSQLKIYSGSGSRIIRGKQKIIIRSQRTADNELQGTFVNEATGEYRCNRCAGAMTLIRAREERVKDFLTRRAKPAQSVPAIRSLTRLKQLEMECFTVRYKDDSGAIVAFNPDLEKGRRKKRRGNKFGKTINMSKARIVERSRRAVLPATIKGFCLVSRDKLLLSPGKTPRYVHLKCFNDWQRERRLNGRENGISVLVAEQKLAQSSRPPVNRPKIENLRKYYYWARRHNLGESYRELAREFGFNSPNAIVDGIKIFMSHLPYDELIPKTLRAEISRLRSK